MVSVGRAVPPAILPTVFITLIAIAQPYSSSSLPRQLAMWAGTPDSLYNPVASARGFSLPCQKPPKYFPLPRLSPPYAIRHL
jgi:hypothetical protein